MNTVSFKKNLIKTKQTNFKKVFTKNKPIFLLALFLLLGILLGTMLIKFADKNLIKFVNTLFLSDFKERLTRPLLDVFISSVSASFVFILIAFFMGLSMWGFILAPAIPFVRGICIGLCESYLYSVYGLKGICFHSLVFLPGIFISSLAVLLITKESIKISNKFYSAIFSKEESNFEKVYIKKYTLQSGFITVIILISSMIDLASSLLFSKFFTF